MTTKIYDLINMCHYVNGEHIKNGKLLPNTNCPIPDGWQIVDRVIDKKSGFLAYAFKKDDTVAIAISGTDFSSFGSWYKDWFGNNMAFFLGFKPTQLNPAEQLYNKVVEKYGHYNKIIVTGSSLGGGVAELIGIDACRNKDKIVTFNPVGCFRAVKRFTKGKPPDNNFSNIYNVVVKNDLVANLFKHYGNALYIDGPISCTKNKNLLQKLKSLIKTIKNPFGNTHCVGDIKKFAPKELMDTKMDNINKLFNVKTNNLDITEKLSPTFDIFNSIISRPEKNFQYAVTSYSPYSSRSLKV